MVYVSVATLKASDDTTSNSIIKAFAQHSAFSALSVAETNDILARDAEDGEKLAQGIRKGIDKGVLAANVVVEPTCHIDVLGKSADAVAAEIVKKLGTAPEQGCVLTLQGLSGTGKGTTVEKLKASLPKAVTWSNGNVFRSITLLAVTYCEQKKIEFSSEALTAEVLKQCVDCLSFGKFGDKFDIQIKGLGLDLLVSQVANTLLKEPRVGKNIPTVAALTQGEVVKFASDAAAAMGSDGCNVLIEGREQTLDYVRTVHRFELMLSDPQIIGRRRAAQRMMGGALKALPAYAFTDSQGSNAFAMLEFELLKIATK
jgi:cytidylate kinase